MAFRPGRRKITPPSQRPKPPVRKVPADSVPYGDSISHNGKYVWVALDGERVVCVAATADEARRKFRQIEPYWGAKEPRGT